MSILVLRVLTPLLTASDRLIGNVRQHFASIVLSAGGWLALAAATIFWVSVVHRFVTGGVMRADDAEPAFLWPAACLLGIATLGSAWILLSGWSAGFLGKSSLQKIYQARLAEAYLGGASASTPADSSTSPADVEWSRYKPHAGGGPVHIVNVCSNYSPSPGAGSIDRRGELLAFVGPGYAWRVEHGSIAKLPEEEATAGTLARWMSVSGAAIAPGLGRMSKAGVSALLTLLGMRSGHWWRDPTARRSRRSFVKYPALLRELTGRFTAPDAEWRYLSDGGHAENTGAYALIAAKCRMVVIADCGADPQFTFSDLENLVRRVRVDLGVRIEFLDPTEELRPAFGTLQSLADGDPQVVLALARIRYPGADQGTLILVKPKRVPYLPVDVASYARDHPAFPQESTSDQLFHEAQWESYYRLGRAAGRQFSSFVFYQATKVVEASRGTPGQDLTKIATKASDASRASNHSLSWARLDKIRPADAGVATIGLGTVASAMSALLTIVEPGGPAAKGLDEDRLHRIYQQAEAVASCDPQAKGVAELIPELLRVWSSADGARKRALAADGPYLQVWGRTLALCDLAAPNAKPLVCEQQEGKHVEVHSVAVTMALARAGYWPRTPTIAERERSARLQDAQAFPEARKVWKATCHSQRVAAASLEQARASQVVVPASGPSVAEGAGVAPRPAPDKAVTHAKPSHSGPAALASPAPSASDKAPDMTLASDLVTVARAQVSDGTGEALKPPCHGVPVSFKIYDTAGYAAAKHAASNLGGTGTGAIAMGIEDVAVIAESQQRTVPWIRAHQVQYHDPRLEACAKALGIELSSALPGGITTKRVYAYYRQTKHAVEVHIAPKRR